MSDTNESLHHFKHQQSQTLHEFYITGEILTIDVYIPLIKTLGHAESTDVVHIYLSTPGGSLETVVSIINAMRNSPAVVTTILSGSVASAGALIFLAGDTRAVENHSMLMFHNYSSWSGGKGHELMASAEATDKWGNKINHDLCVPFLTTRELKQLKEGKDLYFDSDEIMKKLKKEEKVNNNK